jgi:hypothetical protein
MIKPNFHQNGVLHILTMQNVRFLNLIYFRFDIIGLLPTVFRTLDFLLKSYACEQQEIWKIGYYGNSNRRVLRLSTSGSVGDLDLYLWV